MEYNKNQFHKMNDRKILHKIGKHWVTVSLSTLMAIGGVAFAQHTATANADPVNNGQSNFKVNSAQSSPNSTLRSSSANSSKLSQSSAKSTSQDYSSVNQKADQLHARILNNSIHQIKPSAVNSSSRRNLANHPKTITETPTVLKDSKTANKAINNSITVQYLDQHNHKVGGGTVSGRPAHSTIDVINPNDGGISVPNGYHLAANEDPNFVFNQQPQTAILSVQGNNANSVVRIRRIERHLNGSTTSDVQSDNVSGVIGSDIDIQPHDYVPKNGISPSDVYYIAPSDHSHFVTLHAGDQKHPTAYVTPNEVTFNYNEEKRSPNKLGTIMVHYQDYNMPGIDISKIPVKGEIGDDVDMNSYRTNVPQTYYYVKTQKAAKTFQNLPQDVVVYVKQLFDVRAKLFFENIKNNNQVVGSHDLVGKHAGAKIPYDAVINTYMPKGYRYVSMGSYDPVLKKNDKDIVYVEPGHQPTPTEDGSIIVNYYLNGNRNDLVKSESDRKAIGSPFSTSHYIANPPSGYHVVKVLDGQNIQAFKNTLQDLDIDVASNKPSDKPAQQATVSIDYLDNSNPKDVVKTISDVKGTAGSAIDFTPFKTSPDLPSGYTFNRIGNQNAVYKNGAVEDIYVNKKSPQGATIYIDYKDYTDPSTVLKTVSDSGMPNQQIDYTKYEKAPYLPKNYSFLTLGSTDSTFVNGAHETILVKADQTPPAPKPASKQVTGTLLYKDDQSGNIEGQTTIKGNQDDPINYSEYTNNGSQYMPNGYHFDRIAEGSGQYLEPGATYTIMVSKNGSNQPKNVQGTMYYLDSSTGQAVGKAPINGTAGEIINYHSYESSQYIPQGYHFDRVSPDSGTKLESGGSYTILVDKNVQQITDNIVYKDYKSGQQVGNVQQITGNQGSTVNLSPYEANDSQYMPSGYLFYGPGVDNSNVLEPNRPYTILVQKKEASDVTTHIIFRNTQTGQNMQVMSDVGEPGTPIDYNTYIDQFLSKHKLSNGHYQATPASNDDTDLRANGNEIINVKAIMDTVTDDVIYRDASNNDQVGNPQKITGTVGSQANLGPYEDNNSMYMPQGYQFAHADSHNNSKIEPNTDYTIFVNSKSGKHPNPQMIYGTVYYRDKNGSTITTSPISGYQGTSVDYGKYESQLPTGYHLVGIANNASRILEPNAYYGLVIAKNAPQRITDNVVYRNAANGDQITTALISGPQGSNVNLNPYEMNNSSYMPKGYQFAYADPNNISVIEPNTNYTIFLKTSSSNNQMINAKLNYWNVKNGSIVKMLPISGTKGSIVNYNKYMNGNDVPSGYKVIGLGTGVNNTFEPDGNYTVLVEPTTNNNKPQVINGTLNYKDSNGNTIKSVPISGTEGSNVNYNYYMQANQMPQGYHLVGLGNGTSTTFEPNGSYSIIVAANPTNNTPSNSNNHHDSDNNGNNGGNGNGNNTNNNGNNGNHNDNNGNGSNTNGNGGSGNSGNSNYPNNGNNSNQPIFTDHNTMNGNGSSQNNGSLPQTGEHHNYDRQISEILVMMGISLASLGRCIRHRYDN